MSDGSRISDSRRTSRLGDAPEASRLTLITVPYESHPFTGGFQCTVDSKAVDYIQNEPEKCAKVGCGEFFVLPAKGRYQCIDGYYHLVQSSIRREHVVGSDDKKMRPDRPSGVFTIAYIARHDLAATGTGAALVMDAAFRARDIFRNWGLTLYANNRKLVNFYEKLGFKITRPGRDQMTAEDASPVINCAPYYMYATYKKLLGY